ncbi:MAG: hypothetical protein QOF24_1551 [Verrucomicrobiota bacterium]
MEEAAIIEAASLSFFPGPLQLARRTIHADYPHFLKPFSQTAGIKTRAATELDQFFSGPRQPIRPKRFDHPLRVVTKKFFSAENVEPGEVLK